MFRFGDHLTQQHREHEQMLKKCEQVTGSTKRNDPLTISNGEGRKGCTAGQNTRKNVWKYEILWRNCIKPQVQLQFSKKNI